MHDWPSTSIRTRLFSAVVVSMLLVQATIFVFDFFGTYSRQAANEIGAMAMLITLGMCIWAVSVNHDPAVRLMGAALAAGLLLRAIGLVQFTYLAPMPPPMVPDMATRTVLVIGYLLLGFGVVASAIGLGRRVHVRIPLIVAALGSALIGIALGFAAFGPLPSVATELTTRDHFAIGLLLADTALLAGALFVTAALLQLPGGTLSRAWVWISVGLVLAALGDAVLPMLEPADAANYVSLLWGLAYVMTGVGASLMVDIERWHLTRGEHLALYPLSGQSAAEPEA